MSSPTTPSKCPRCGASLTNASVDGLCAKCLGALNFDSVSSPAESGKVEPVAPLTVSELAPHFPQLEIIECLGRGGMGVVYKARQKSLNRLVALKLLAPERVTDARFAERFAREAQALAALNHPNIVTIHDFGQAGGFYFLLMEFVDGVNLRQAMNARNTDTNAAGRFTPEQALAIVPPMCEALQFAHEKGIVHRDIKPENLLLDKNGRVKIADFGIARMLGDDAGGSAGDAAESQPAGTPQYMAPEQSSHLRTDHRADIYSLGVVLYEMLTGELPGAKLQPPSKRVQVDARIDEIVLRALETKPELRYQTAGEMRKEVQTVAAQTPKPDAKVAMPVVTPRFSRAAIAGACWAPLFFIVVLLGTMEFRVEAGEYHGPAWWQTLLALTLLPLGFAAPFGTTILGWVAVANIRRSAGKTYGLGLAVFDGLLYPLTTLTGFVAWFWWWIFAVLLRPRIIEIQNDGTEIHAMHSFFFDHRTGLTLLCTVITAGLLCSAIIFSVWRAVNRPTNFQTSTSKTDGLMLAVVIGGVVLGIVGLMVVFGLLFAFFVAA